MTSPLRVLLVGCGSISRVWLEAIAASSRLELVGLVDMNRETAVKRAAEFTFEGPVGDDLDAMLELTRPDVVFDCTVPEAHHDVTLAALRAGAHVLGEKPMAVSLEQARAQVAAAKSSGKAYAVMQNRRYDPTIRALRAFLQSGVIGPLTTLHADFFIGAHFGGFREQMRHVLLKDMAIHTFDAARFLTGANPRSVYCLEWNPAESWYDHDASATAIFELSRGIVFTYRGSWCSEGLPTPWESSWRILGTKGTVIWDERGIRCEVAGQPGGLVYEQLAVAPPIPKPDAAPSWHAAAIEAFSAAVLAGQTPETSCEDNIHSLEMVLGATSSADTRRVVALDSA